MREQRVGRRFGRWTVLSEAEHSPYNTDGVLCRCDCGTEKVIQYRSLKNMQSTSCGCRRRQVTIARNFRHGGSGTRLYRVWYNMVARCEMSESHDYDWYGGIGIRVCEEWHDFPVFREWALANGYTDNLTIDRVNCGGNYEPSNCRWVTYKEQSRNTNRTRMLTAFGETKCLLDWAHDIRCKVKVAGLSYRLSIGMSPEDAISSPNQRGANASHLP